MTASVLDRVLIVDRERQVASKYGGFAAPVIHERAVSPEEGPFVVTSTKGGFLDTRIRKEGVVWAGFCECPLKDEGRIVRTLYDHLRGESWANHGDSLGAAVSEMRGRGLDPKAAIVSAATLGEACGRVISEADAEKLMWGQGYVAEVDGIRIYSCEDLVPGSALVFATPAVTGFYVRSGYSLAIMVCRADTSVALVTP